MKSIGDVINSCLRFGVKKSAADLLMTFGVEVSGGGSLNAEKTVISCCCVKRRGNLFWGKAFHIQSFRSGKLS